LGAEEAAPCRHEGVPPQAVVDSVIKLIRNLGADDGNLRRYGLTAEEYRAALPTAIETIRGSMSASSGAKRDFLENLFQAMVQVGALSGVQIPTYGDDTVYRLTVPSFGDVAVIQKGCPDGAHSSVRWSAPGWAQETYLWWVCDSTKVEPGEHIKGGINRLRKRFFSDAPDTIDGVIFHSPLCGSPGRPCPKSAAGMTVAGAWVPAPCIYIMPERHDDTTEWNWDGAQQRHFPGVLLSAFDVSPGSVPLYTGYVGFQHRSGYGRTTITSRYGRGRSTTFRS
jgi:hypothetical protein